VAVITGIKPEEIDILVTTSSVFAPTPSVASMLVNMFKMREDVQVRHFIGLISLFKCSP
jgi:3-ketoacyl-CoA synthase